MNRARCGRRGGRPPRPRRADAESAPLPQSPRGPSCGGPDAQAPRHRAANIRMQVARRRLEGLHALINAVRMSRVWRSFCGSAINRRLPCRFGIRPRRAARPRARSPPPGRLCRVASPPWARATERTTARPSPIPQSRDCARARCGRTARTPGPVRPRGCLARRRRSRSPPGGPRRGPRPCTAPPHFRPFSTRLVSRRRSATGSPSMMIFSPSSTDARPPVSAASSMMLSSSEASSSLVRSAGRVVSRTNARVAAIIASIWSMSDASLARTSSGTASIRKRRRVSGVRRSWATAPIIAVRSST